MNLAQLVALLTKKLETSDPDSLVLIAEDTDGTRYNLLEDISTEMIEEDYESGIVYSVFTKDDLLDDDPDLDIDSNFKEVIVLWPSEI